MAIDREWGDVKNREKKKACFEYNILEKYTVGMKLAGTENSA